MRVAEVVPSRLANTDEAFRKLVESDADWIVRNDDDLRTLRAQLKESGLARLSKEAFEEFAASCKFSRHGIAGGDTGVLTRELGLKATLSFFHHFGASTDLAVPWQEQGCENGECTWNFWKFCSHSNCHRVVEDPDQ